MTETKFKEKKESKYILNPAQRGIFFKRILPTLIIGSFLWLIGDTFFKYVFYGKEFDVVILIIYIMSMVASVILFIFLYITADENKSNISLLLFFAFAFSAGMVSLPIHLLGEYYSLRVQMFIFATLEAVLIVGLISLILKDKYFAKSYFSIHLILFVLFLILAETIFIYVFNIQNFLFTIPLITGQIMTISMVIMFVGAKFIILNEKAPWMLIIARLFMLYLIVLIGIIVYAVIILIIIIIAILLDDSGIDFPHFFFFDFFYIRGGSSTRKEEKERKKKRGRKECSTDINA